MPALTQKGCKIVTVQLFYSFFGLCEAFVVVLFCVFRWDLIMLLISNS